MTPEEFILELRKFLDKLSNGSKVGKWKYKEQTTLTYTTLKEKWDREEFYGYLFEFEEYQLVFRPLLLEKHRYLLVDSLSSKSDLVNFLLDRNQYFVKGEFFSLRDNYVLNTGGKRRKRETKLAMLKAMAPQDGMIYSCAIESISFEDLIVDFLDWVVLRENAKSLIKAGEERFKEIAVDFQNAVLIQLEEHAFKFGRINSDYMFIKDKQKIIGGEKGHYELVINAGELSIELHFEKGRKKEKDRFQKLIGSLPDRLEWFPWFSSKSICFKETISCDNPNVIPFLLDQLSFLEKELGDKVREVLKNGGKEMNGGAENTSDKKDTMKKEPINQILYGPPGTGKTYHLKDKLFSKYVTKETSISSKEYFENTVAELHWWEVIALAIKEEGKTKVSGIIKNRWVVEKSNQSESKNVRATIWSQLQHYTVDGCAYVKYAKRNSIQVFNKTEDSFWELVPSQVEEQIPDLFKTIEEVNHFKADPDIEIKRYVFTTFHQSYAYEDFIEGIKPVILEEGVEGELTYSIEPGVFKRLCDRARKDAKNRYAIFIDEINRGNVSSIFGELITLIEPDKRAGAKHELSAILPYSKKEFSVPSNVDIYGTMNTADRSVEALDTALRRRFTFKEMMPDYSVLEREAKIGEIALGEVLKTINKRIEILIDRDHLIGHSYFIGVSTTEELKIAFTDKIIPLLQEYFYGDYGKMGLVLGKGFVEKVNPSDKAFAQFEYENHEAFIQPEFKLVIMNDQFDIITAINTLLNKK